MDVDPVTTGLGTAIGTALLVVLRYAFRRLELLVLAAVERGRIRDRRRARNDTLPPPTRTRTHADEWPDDEITDITVLMDRERVRRKTERQRSRGERAPRPGTHHD